MMSASSPRTSLIAVSTGCSVAIALGWLYQAFLDYLPAPPRHDGHAMAMFMAVRFFAPIAYGALVGAGLARFLRMLGSSSSSVALVMAVTCGAVGDFATFSFAHRHFVAAERAALERDAALDPAVCSQRIVELEQTTVVDYVHRRVDVGWPLLGPGSDMRVAGSAVWLVWAVELLVMVLSAGMIAALQVPPRR